MSLWLNKMFLCTVCVCCCPQKVICKDSTVIALQLFTILYSCLLWFTFSVSSLQFIALHLFTNFVYTVQPVWLSSCRVISSLCRTLERFTDVGKTPIWNSFLSVSASKCSISFYRGVYHTGWDKGKPVGCSQCLYYPGTPSFTDEDNA